MKKPLIISASGTRSDLEHFVLEIFSTVSVSKANNSTEVGCRCALAVYANILKRGFHLFICTAISVVGIETNDISIV